MSSVQLITRLISSETNLSSEKLRTGKIRKARVGATQCQSENARKSTFIY